MNTQIKDNNGLVAETVALFKTAWELGKVKISRKTINFLAVAVLFTAALFLTLMGLLLLSFALALQWGLSVDNLALGFCYVGVCYLLLFFLGLMFKRPLLTFFQNLFTDLFYDEEKNL